MKNMTYGNKMRWIAGGLYGLLAVYQMFLSKAILGQLSLANAPFAFLYDIALILVLMALSAWMFWGREAVQEGARRAVVLGTAFCVVFELMTYSLQTDAIDAAMGESFPAWWGGLMNTSAHTVILYVLMILRLLVLIVAAYLVTSTTHEAPEDLDETEEESKEKEPEKEDGEKRDDETIEIVEITEEVIVEEKDEKIEENMAETEEKEEEKG